MIFFIIWIFCAIIDGLLLAYKEVEQKRRVLMELGNE